MASVESLSKLLEILKIDESSEGISSPLSAKTFLLYATVLDSGPVPTTVAEAIAIVSGLLTSRR